MTYLYLEPGQDWIEISAIPKMIADALHPEVPDGVASTVSALLKIAKEKRLADQWCGHGNNFHVSLTEQDLEWLNTNAWAGLTPLAFDTSSAQRPRPLASPPTVDEWKTKYLPAANANPPQGWELDWRTFNPQADQIVKHHQAEVDHWEELQKRSAAAQLVGHDPISRRPEPEAVGDRLGSLVLSISNLAQYCEPLGVTIARRYEREPIALLTLNALRREPPSMVVFMRESYWGRDGIDAWQKADAWVADLEQEAQLQSRGLFRMINAARLLNRADSALETSDLVRRWAPARVKGRNAEGRRLARGSSGLPVDDKAAADLHNLVSVADVDEWLREMGSDHALSPLTEAARLEGTSRPQMDAGSDFVGWYDATLRAGFWFQDDAVTPTQAAMLLCELDPYQTKLEIAETSANSETGPTEFAVLLDLFTKVDKRDPSPRPLREWMAVARRREARYHSWADRYSALTLKHDTEDPVVDLPTEQVKRKEWRLLKPKRQDSLRQALYSLLMSADRAQHPPTARDVMNLWESTKPPGILKVHASGVDFVAENKDGAKSADIRQINERIQNLIQWV